MFKNVVFPAPVPPEIKILYLASTSAFRNLSASGVTAPIATSFSIVSGSLGNLRIVITGPSNAIGGITILTREPSSNRTSNIGVDSFTMRFPSDAICCAMSLSRSSESNVRPVSYKLPSFSTKICCGPLIIISVTSSSSINSCSTSNFRMELNISRRIFLRSRKRIYCSCPISVITWSITSVRYCSSTSTPVGTCCNTLSHILCLICFSIVYTPCL